MTEIDWKAASYRTDDVTGIRELSAVDKKRRMLSQRKRRVGAGGWAVCLSCQRAGRLGGFQLLVGGLAAWSSRISHSPGLCRGPDA